MKSGGQREQAKKMRTPKQKARRMIADILSNYYEEEWFDDFEEDEREAVKDAYEDISSNLYNGKAA